jgi:CTP:molybdopterin cytidylyltransferase MocA
MGQPKGLLRFSDGTPWVARAVTALVDGGCAPILVVTGASAEQVAALVPSAAVIVVANDWDEGMGASLRAGLKAAVGSCAAIITLVDTLGVTAEIVARLVQVAGPGVLARAAYDGVPGHPVLIGADHWDGVLAMAQGDAGARGYLAGRGDVVLVESGDIGSGEDIDTPDELN